MPLAPSLAPRAPSTATLTLLSNALRDLRISPCRAGAAGAGAGASATGAGATVTGAGAALQTRHASHQAQGRANGAKDGPGKRLGAKKTAGEYVVPGNMIFKQRGTHWFAGDHCLMGRDHTIHAAAPGYVRYYRDPARHPSRKYIGLVFDPAHTLPQPPHAVRRRRLGMLAYQMPTPTPAQLTGDLTEAAADHPTDIRQRPNSAARQTRVPKKSRTPGAQDAVKLTLRPGYQYRASNHEIGRAAERKEAAAQAKGQSSRAYGDFVPGDRFAAWRKSSVRIARNNERRAMGRGRKGSGKRA